MNLLCSFVILLPIVLFVKQLMKCGLNLVLKIIIQFVFSPHKLNQVYWIFNFNGPININ